MNRVIDMRPEEKAICDKIMKDRPFTISFTEGIIVWKKLVGDKVRGINEKE